jgi:PAS domain S-box-containing protein
MMSPTLPRKLSLASMVLSVTTAIGLGILFNARENDRRENQAAARLATDVKKQASAQGNLINTILFATDLAIVTVSDKGDIVGWNEGAVRKFGYTQADMIGKSLGTLMPDAQSADRHKRAFNDHTVTDWVRRGIAMDCTMPTKSGGKRHVLVFAYEIDQPPAKFAAIIHTPAFVVIKDKG